jgi:hypothetical protein
VPPATSSRRLGADEIEAVVACLAPAGRFEAHAREVEGLGHLLVLSRDVAPETVETVLHGVVAAMRGTPGVFTLATDRAAVTVAMGEGAAIAAAARHPGAPVALMERLVARAAAAIGLEPSRASGAPDDELREGSAAAGVDLAALGVALDGFGRVVPAVFRHDNRGLDVYVFRPADTAPARVGELAAAVDAALGGIDLGRLDAASVRVAGRRTELRWAGGRAGGAVVLAVSGPVARAGLARRQAARAAAALEVGSCR